MKCYFFLITFILSVICENENEVSTPFGKIMGRTVNILGESIKEYLGIPYSYPRTQTYRFKAPMALKTPAWNKTYYAVHKAGACPQILKTLNFSAYDELVPMNGTYEYCLRLNMWVPKGNNLPIIIFFNGGDFTTGSASLDMFNGSVLAQKTNSIVISANYRLGFLGFAYLGKGLKISGNMGFLDQQMVLKWVRVAIEDFNGNKNSVTIFGLDSGASSVSAHLFAEDSNGLFTRGIMSSGTITNILNTISPKLAEANTRNVSNQLNCKGTDDQILKCLENAKLSDLLEAASKVVSPHNMPTSFAFLPIMSDNVFFKGNLYKKFMTNNYNKNIDLMVGNTAEVASFKMVTGLTNSSIFNCQFFPLKPVNSTENSCEMNLQNFKKIAGLGGHLLGLNFTGTKNLYSLYNNNTGLSYRTKSINLLSDILYYCDLFKFAVKYSGQASGSVYFYDYIRRSPISSWPPWIGAMLGDDMIDIFGHPFRHKEKYEHKILKEEENFSENVIWAIGNFSKYGKPTINWDKFNMNNAKGIVLNGTLDLSKTILHKNLVKETCKKIFYLVRNFNVKNQKVESQQTTTTPEPTVETTKKKKDKGFLSRIKGFFKKSKEVFN